MEMEINIVDAGCGTGKTTGVIDKINHDITNTKYIYITPFLTEVERVKKECKSRKFKEPEQTKNKTKMNNLKELIKKKQNIVSTHALFKNLDNEILDLEQLKDYVLVMDEVADVVNTVNISKDDMRTIVNTYTKENEKGILEWTEKKYEGKLSEYKKMIELKSIMVHRDKNGKPISLVWVFPIEIFKSFKEIYILTYMFEGQIQKYYYDMYKFKYKHWYIKDMSLTEDYQKYDMKVIKSLINICEKKNLNKIGDSIHNLSSTWFKRKENKDNIKILRDNTYNFFRNVSNSKSDNNLWTTFKVNKKDLKGKGYSKGFAAINIRATNEYIDRNAIAYLANKYLDPMVKNFFNDMGVKVDENKYALSELIQFIFRGSIRKNEPIYLYIPSKRMRNLLKEWINQ